MAPTGSIGIAGDGYPIKVVRRNLSEDVKAGENCVMKINGEWYDVADFMDKHPGGDILKEFVGKDITVMYRLWHPSWVFKNPEKFVKKVPVASIEFLDEPENKDAAYRVDTRPPPLASADERYIQLYADAEKRGFFKGTTRYLYERFALLGLYFCIAAYCFHFCSEIYMHAIGAFSMFQVWYQSAGLMHDSGHNQYFNGNIEKNSRLCFWSANIGVGISSSFWKWEHVEHHTFTNSFDAKLGNADPQGTEDVWTQDAQLVPFRGKSWFHWLILRIQAILFPIAIIVFSRIGIVIDSFVTETRGYEFAGIILHFSWVFWLLSTVYVKFGLLYAFACYYMAALSFCVLAFQLQSNHMNKPWIRKMEEFDSKGRPLSHIHRHIRACTNIKMPRWLDAYWGGLHFHMEHHCFPRMAREHYRTFAPELREFCKTFGYEYHLQSFSESMWSVMVKLNQVRGIRDIFDLGKEE